MARFIDGKSSFHFVCFFSEEMQVLIIFPPCILSLITYIQNDSSLLFTFLFNKKED